ncbi:YggS family pyridoxal phosphate enzyme [Lapillicoccus sp.]|uniref:YggS family pyridoxal phosphate enzyme n=1 Tax=Lapillicoccus sp. TaxID=1909287 RepID=UPI003265E6AE
MSVRPQERGRQLADNLQTVRRRVTVACDEAGRNPAEINLVVVTKFFPASDVRLLADLGVSQFGESRDQEARSKSEDVALEGVDLTWHFIGQLQTNKAASVVSYADVVHTADRPKLVRALATAAEREGRRPRVLVQVNLDPRLDPSLDPGPDPRAPSDAAHTSRGGIAVGHAEGLADLIAGSAALDLGGVMAVAPADADPGEAFARLAEVATRIQASHPDATWVSAGMSGDLEAAVRHGATHLRVGSAILGSRPPLR